MAEGQCLTYPDTPCRVNLDLMPHPTALWMYLLTAVAFGIFAYGCWEMWRVWRIGKPWKPGDWKVGLKRLMVGLASHRKFRREPREGTHHQWVFLGFVVLFIGTAIVAIDADFFEKILHSKLLFGKGYLLYEATLDLFGVLFLLGIVLLAWRRYKEHPGHLHATKTPEAPAWLPKMGADSYALLFLFLIGITGFLLEGIRLDHQIATDGITYARWSFVGYAVGWPFADWTPAQMESFYAVLWWTHFTLWTSVLAILPWTKLKHIVTSSLNLYFHDPKRQSLPALPTPFSLQKIIESGSTDMPSVGYQTIRDLTWKDRLALDACTNCGRCEAQCPATAAGRPLSPRKLIQDLKAEMWRDYRSGAKDAKPLASVEGVDSALKEVTLWSCTTCRGCVSACPVDIEHIDLITEMRRGLVMQSKVDEHQQKLLVNLTNAGNPYGFPASDRANWISQLPPGVTVKTTAEVGAGNFDYLWWVGCSGSYDPRNQKVTTAIATILNAAGVKFAILGTEERCNGDPARRLGEEGRFQQSVMQQYGVAKVIAQCPHCFNTLRNEYPEFGAKLEVVHHSELIERLMRDGAIKVRDGKELKVTYHDSCYLMRHNGIGEGPRTVLKKANNGMPVLEMAQNKEKGLCCGAGGANMWYEVKDETTRINVIRAKQAAETGADTVATACPFCLTMMTDGLSLTGQEGKMEARDLAEIVADHLDWTPPAPPTPPPTEAPMEVASGGWSG